MANGEDLEERFLAEFTSAAQSQTPIAFEAAWMDWWLLLCAVQLACRHPGFYGPTRKGAEGLARQMFEKLAPEGALRRLAEMGWRPEFDVPESIPASEGAQKRAGSFPKRQQRRKRRSGL
jgi:hypothetical protein